MIRKRKGDGSGVGSFRAFHPLPWRRAKSRNRGLAEAPFRLDDGGDSGDGGDGGEVAAVDHIAPIAPACSAQRCVDVTVPSHHAVPA